MNFNEKPKDIQTLIDGVNESFGKSEDTYTNGETTPAFKDWLPAFNEISITEETLPLLREIYNEYIYNVPLPETASVEKYISKLESRKQKFQDSLNDFKTRLEQGKVEPIHFDPEKGEIESEENYLSTINQIQGKINILKANKKF